MWLDPPPHFYINPPPPFQVYPLFLAKNFILSIPNFKQKRICWCLRFIRSVLIDQSCQWDLHNHACAGRHADKSICQHNWLCKQHNKFYWKSHREKFLFFSRFKGDLLLSFCIFHEKRYKQLSKRCTSF